MLLFAIAGLVLLLAAAVISYPLIFSSVESHVAASPHNTEYSEQDALLEALSELEVSFQTGKLSEQDYQSQKTRLQRQYLQALEQAGAPAST
jgi:cytochrome c-type biogenesis protein CcmI